MIPNRKQDIKGQVRGVREGASQKHSGASSEDPWDHDKWGTPEEWDKAVNMVAHGGDLVAKAQTQVQINRGKKPRNANKSRGRRTGGWVSPAQFGSMPLGDDTGGDITTTSDSGGVGSAA